MSKLFPRKCSCGGPLKFERDFGRVFSYCMRCTPVTTIKVSPNGTPSCLDQKAEGLSPVPASGEAGSHISSIERKK